jgi:hypothetical protein
MNMRIPRLSLHLFRYIIKYDLSKVNETRFKFNCFGHYSYGQKRHFGEGQPSRELIYAVVSDCVIIWLDVGVFTGLAHEQFLK